MTTVNYLISLTDELKIRLTKMDKPSVELLEEVGDDLSKIHEKLSFKSDLAEETAAEPSPPAKEAGTTHIWSDGACSGNPGPGGWGTIILKDGEYREYSGFSKRSTNNIMELTGALEGILRVPPGSDITLTSDSRYLVQGMTEWIKGWKRRGWKKSDGGPVLNRELWIRLDKEAGQRNIEWRWVKGHSSHPQNERCDQLAREAVKNGQKFPQ